MEQMFRKVIPVRFMPLIQAMFFSNAVSLLLFFIRVFGAESFRFGFLFWNLLLAAVPLPLAILLVKNLARQRWLSWQNILLTTAWLGFLPNSFYLATDLIHIHLTGEINILFDVVLFMSCIFNGFVFGFMSLLLVHRELLRRLDRLKAHSVVAGIILLSSFAIYLGRYLRWNSWDIIVHPFAIMFDVITRVVNPAAHPQTITTTVTFFLLLSSMYMVMWEFINLLRNPRR